MKTWFKSLLGGLAALALLPALALAQSPVIDVKITAPANETSGKFVIAAQAAASAVVTTTTDAGGTTSYQVTSLAVVASQKGLGYDSATPPWLTIDGVAVSVTYTFGSAGSIESITLASPVSVSSATPNVVIGPPGGYVTIQGVVVADTGPFTTTIYVNGAIARVMTHGATFNSDFIPPRPGVYYISAVTIDAYGNRAVSNTIRYFSVGTQILSPETNAILPMGSSAVITADATVASGFIKSIRFYKTAAPVTSDADLVGLTPYATDGTSPYTCSYTASASDPAVNYFTAVATDNNGADLPRSQSLTLRNITPIGNLPSVSVINPTDGSSVAAGTPTKIVVDAQDLDGYITRVEFYLNGNPLGTVTKFPYSMDWTPSVAGVNKLEAIAYDDKSNAVKSAPSMVTVTAGLPTGEISSPLPGSAPIIKGSTIPVTVRAAGSDGGLGTLSNISLLIDGKVSSTIPKANADGTYPPLADPLTFSWTANVTLGDHKLSARITDNAGISITTSEVTVTVIDNQAPIVSITSPITASSVSIGQSIAINADASDPDGAIASVDFYVNGTKIATSTTFPYTTSYRPTTSGTYTIQAVATDNLGKTTQSSSVVVTVAPPIGSLPLVSLRVNDPSKDYVAPGGTTPVSSGSIQVDMGSTLLLGASALDSDGTITKVEFYANGTLVGTSTTAPYVMTLHLSDFGSLQLVAVATDNDGNRAQSDPVDLTVLPQIGVEDLWVKLQNPVNGQAYIRGEQITFSATSNVGSAATAKVDIYLNGILWHTISAQPFTYTVGIAQSGHYEVRAVLRDVTSTTVSDPVYIDILDNRPPSVSITKPSNGTVVKAGSFVNLEASAKDSDGTVSKVEYFANGQSIGSSTLAPYRLSWSPSSQGVYKLTAMATDNSGDRTQSSIVVLLATDPSLGASGSGDVVYFSPDLPGNPFGQYAMVRVGGMSGLFFGQMPAYVDPTTKKTVAGPTRFFSGLTVDAAGRVSAANVSDLSGFTTDGSATLTIKDALNQATPVILSIPAASTSIPSGYYTASVDGNADLQVIAITSADARVAFALVSGGKADIGFSTLMADGTIGNKTSGMTTLGGTTIKGKFDFSNGLLSATLSGAYTGTAYGSLADGIAFSDGTLYNLSSRGKISDNNPMVAGFVVSGTESKNILVRAIGPSLTAFGISGASTDTRLDIYDSNNVRVAFNTDWAGNPVLAQAMSSVGAFALNSASKDAVVLSMLKPGSYTAMVTGTPGAALVELYDVDSISPYSPKRLLNISTRALVEANGSLNAGFMVGGYASKRVLIRAVGPGLSAFGVSGAMADPVLKLYRQDGTKQTLIRFNDNWQGGNDSDLVVQASQLVGAFALGAGSKDAAILINLAPGTYSAVLSSASGAAGTALVEVYEVTTPDGQ